MTGYAPSVARAKIDLKRWSNPSICLTRADGPREGYHRLLLASGGCSLGPLFEGADKRGVFLVISAAGRIAAASMIAEDSVTLSGTTPADTLEVLGIDVTATSEATTTDDKFIVLRKADIGGSYRRLMLREVKIVSAILLGSTRRLQPIEQLIAEKRDVSSCIEQ